MRVYARFVGLDKTAAETRLTSLLAHMSLEHKRKEPIKTLSGGMKRRLTFVRALLSNPELLILDEPTTGLDPNQIVEIRHLIREIGKTKTIIFSTHILPEVEAIAGRVIIINRGKIVADEALDTLRGNDGHQNILRVEFERPGFQTAALSATLPVLEVRPEDSEGKAFTFSFPGSDDLRPAVYAASLSQGNPIALLQKKEKNLEEIFRGLTH